MDHGAGLPGKPGNYRIAKFPGTWARTTGAHCKGFFFEMGDYMGFHCSLGQGNSQYVMGRKCDQIGSCHPEKNEGLQDHLRQILLAESSLTLRYRAHPLQDEFHEGVQG